MHSLFTNIEAKKQVINLYYQKLNQLQIPYELITIETSFGNTNVIVTGNPKNPPLVLVHDENSCAPIALEKCIDLLKEFRIYAIDVLGQPNLSAEVQLPLKDNSYGKWFYEIQSRLQIFEAYLVGISFGGFICWKALTYDQTRIRKAFLIVPKGIIKENLIRKFIYTWLPIKMFQFSKKVNHLQEYLTNIYTDYDAFRLVFLSKIVLHHKIDNTPIPLITKEKARKIQIPLYLVASEDDVLFSRKKLIKKTKRIFPSFKKAFILKDAKHIPTKKDYEKIVEFITENVLLQNH